jgi:hypothetical protein
MDLICRGGRPRESYAGTTPRLSLPQFMLRARAYIKSAESPDSLLARGQSSR